LADLPSFSVADPFFEKEFLDPCWLTMEEQLATNFKVCLEHFDLRHLVCAEDTPTNPQDLWSERAWQLILGLQFCQL
jgi:hypothetical protein